MVMAGKNSCSSIAKKYEKCIASINGKDFDAMCEAYKSSNCQKLYTSPKSILKNCDNDFIENTVSGLVKMVNVLDYSCTRDESDHYCPLANIIQKTQLSLKTIEDYNLSDVFKGLKDSCSSKKCLNISIKYLNTVKAIASKNKKVKEQEIKDVNELLSYLNNCSKNNSNGKKDQDKNDKKSDKTSSSGTENQSSNSNQDSNDNQASNDNATPNNESIDGMGNVLFNNNNNKINEVVQSGAFPKASLNEVFLVISTFLYAFYLYF